jgi:predicted dehydrogenase
MRVGIVGTGRMAASRAECILKNIGVELAWVCSRSRQRGGEFVATLDGRGHASRPAVFDLFSDALAQGNADAVFITSPNSHHRRTAEEAFAARKHVFLEYPPTVLPSEGEELISLAKRSGMRYVVGLTHLQGGQHKAVAAYCRGDTPLGSPRVYQHIFCSGNPISRWYDREELSGGMFVSSLYHYIDEAIDFFGDPRAMSSAYTVRRTEGGVIGSDTGSIQMSFRAGCAAQISYARGMNRPGVGTRRVIIFDQGYIVEDVTGIRVLTPEGDEELAYDDIDALQVETDFFIETARQGLGVDASVSHAQRSLVVADEARRLAIS